MKKQIMIVAAVALVLCQPIIACQFPDPGDNCPGGPDQEATKDNFCRGILYVPSGPSQWCVSIPEWGYTDCTPYSVTVYKYVTDFAVTYDSNGVRNGCNWNSSHRYVYEAGTCEQDYVPASAGYCGE